MLTLLLTSLCVSTGEPSVGIIFIHMIISASKSSPYWWCWCFWMLLYWCYTAIKQHYSTCKHRFVLRDWDRVVYLILVTQRNIWEICWLVCPVYVSWAELWMCVGKKSNYPIICFIRVSKHPSAQYCPPLCLPATQVEEVEAFPPSHLIDSSCNLYNFLLLLSSPHIYQLLLYTLFHIKIDSSYYSQTFSRLEDPNIESKDRFLSN